MGHGGLENGAISFPRSPRRERFCSLEPKKGSKTFPRGPRTPENGAWISRIKGRSAEPAPRRETREPSTPQQVNPSRGDQPRDTKSRGEGLKPAPDLPLPGPSAGPEAPILPLICPGKPRARVERISPLCQYTTFVISQSSLPARIARSLPDWIPLLDQRCRGDCFHHPTGVSCVQPSKRPLGAGLRPLLWRLSGRHDRRMNTNGL